MRIVDNGGDGFQRTFLGGVSVLAPGAREGATIQAGIPFAYTFSAQDAEQSQLTYTLVSGPAGATLNATTGLLTWTPAATLSGWYPVVLRAADGQGGTAELNLTLRVQPEVYNYAPKITSQPLTKVRFGSTYRSLVQVYDPNGDPISFQLTQAPAGMTLVTRDGSATSTGATGYLSWTPTAGQVGSHAVTVQVTDGRSAPVTQTFTAQVLGSRENISPAITSRPTLVAVIGRTYSYDIVAGDADQDALLYRPDTTANTANGTKPIIPVGASVNPLRGTVRWVPSEDQIGLQRIAIEVIDQQGGATRQEWEVLVQGVNQPPIFASVPPTEAAANVSYTYAPTVSDPEGDKLAYTLSAAPAGMTISPTTGVITWLPASVTSTPQTVTVRASDSFGGIAEQTYGVIVRSALRNLPPVITASTVTGVEPGATFTHTVLATDPEGTALTWSLLQKPAAMQIAPATGEITWATTAAADLGQHSVTVLVTDAGGASTSQTFIVSVMPNQIPSVGNTAPVTTALTGTAYTSWFDVTDGNGDPLTYRIIDGPPGLTIDSTGHITWTTPSAPGSYDIVLAASDGRGGEIRQTYTLVTTSDSTLPQVSLIAQYNVVKVGEVVGFQAFASDNDALADLVLTVDGTAVPMDASHIAHVTMTRGGFIQAVATARDRSGNTAASTVEVRVIDPADQSYPVVTINSGPLEASNGLITAATTVTGSVTDDALEFWRMDIAPIDLIDATNPAADNPAFKVLATGTTNTAAASGRIDPTVLANGSYYLRLIAGDRNGNITAKGYIVSIHCDLKLGRLLLPVTDLSIPVAGIPITITRVYDSLEANRSGDFGYGWSLALQNARIQESIPVGEEEKQGIPPFFGGESFNYGTRVTLLAPDGRRIGFTFQPKVKNLNIPGGPPVNPLFGTVYEPYYKPDAGNYYKLEAEDAALQINGPRVSQYLTNFSYNPREYKLTSKDGTVYRYDQFDGLLDITNRLGVCLV
ncbi:MAG TPA: putative Ig domain-containing protein, partial [Candidatus Methylacidiphilales bacterium]|nr:putative Ig domain-containing protein [Candidatus Methylacidiphilales bacterium]